MAVVNTLAYYNTATITTVQIFIVQSSGGQCYKTFYTRNLLMLVKSLAGFSRLVQGLWSKPEPTRVKYLKDAPLQCRLLALTHKHQNSLKRHAKDKQSDLLRKIINQGQKSFKTLAPGDHTIKFYVISQSVRHFQSHPPQCILCRQGWRLPE